MTLTAVAEKERLEREMPGREIINLVHVPPTKVSTHVQKHFFAFVAVRQISQFCIPWCGAQAFDLPISHPTAHLKPSDYSDFDFVVMQSNEPGTTGANRVFVVEHSDSSNEEESGGSSTGILTRLRSGSLRGPD